MANHTQCAHADEALMSDDRKRWIVGMIDRDVAGYTPTTYEFARPEQARACAASINESLGVSPQEAQEIVLSSMFPGIITDHPAVGRQVTTDDADDIVNVGTVVGVSRHNDEHYLIEWPDHGRSWSWHDQLAPVHVLSHKVGV